MNSNTLNYVLTAIKFLIATIGIIFVVMIFAADEIDGAVVNSIALTEYTIYACVAAWVLFGLYQIVTDIKRSIPTLIGFALFLIVVFVGYGMANGEMLQAGETEVTATVSRWSGGGLKAFYILLGIAVVAAIATEIRKIIR